MDVKGNFIMKITHLLPFILALSFIVVISNYLVVFPINDYITWGTLTYPFAFLISDLTVRKLGANQARISASFGFVVGFILSYILADIAIATASCLAFIIGQLLDISVFSRLRKSQWWQAPLASGFFAAALDTILFYSLAFYYLPPLMTNWGLVIGDYSDLPWVSLAFGDYATKLLIIIIGLIPYGYLLTILAIKNPSTSSDKV